MFLRAMMHEWGYYTVHSENILLHEITNQLIYSVLYLDSDQSYSNANSESESQMPLPIQEQKCLEEMILFSFSLTIYV
jgi:hypothetical protein